MLIVTHSAALVVPSSKPWDYPQFALTDLSENAIPEPITLSLFGAGVAGTVAARRRKKAAQT